MDSLIELRLKSGVSKFVSVLGKSTIPRESAEYLFVESATEALLSRGYGIIHGGYKGGAMAAASDTAHSYLATHQLPLERNIGVPMVGHDGLWERVDTAIFTEAPLTIFERLAMVTSGDIAVFAPLGGDGTEAEESFVFHENMVRTQIGSPVVPMIFLQTSSGTQWKQLLEYKLSVLTTGISNLESLPWIHFVTTTEGFEEVIDNLA
jgi:predicted Rossmann-fold nucleotide-binding protein